MSVEKYIEDLIEREGGYTDHPNDKGGPTNFGVTEQVARAFGYEGDMKSMTVDQAKWIYLSRYWLQPRFNEINTISPRIAEELFDTGVNMGTSTATKFLQRALNVLNLGSATYPDMEVDGALGAMTIAALKALLAKRGPAGEEVVLKMLNAQQSVRYMEIAEKSPNQEDFEFGWQLNRVT